MEIEHRKWMKYKIELENRNCKDEKWNFKILFNYDHNRKLKIFGLIFYQSFENTKQGWPNENQNTSGDLSFIKLIQGHQNHILLVFNSNFNGQHAAAIDGLSWGIYKHGLMVKFRKIFIRTYRSISLQNFLSHCSYLL